MDHLSHGKRGLQAWVPSKYKLLVNASMKKIIGTYFSWLGFSLALFLVLATPSLLLLPQQLESSLSSFDTFVLDANVSADGPVVLSRDPRIVVDLDKENRTDEQVLFNEEGVLVKRSFWRGTKIIPWEIVSHIPEHADSYTRWLMPLLLLVLPSLLLAVALFAVLFGVVLLGVTWAIGFGVTRIARFSIGPLRLLKALLLALVPFTIILVVPMLYLRLFFIPVAAYLAISFFSVWFCGESRLEHRAKQ